MKSIARLILTILLFGICAYAAQGNKMESQAGDQPRLTKLWETPKGLEVPESVLYDENHQIVYVSNISGKSTLKNNKGFIAKVGIDGSIKPLNWVTGLNAPKGMGIFGDMLYVTDIDQVHKISIPTGTIIKTWNVQGAKFSNDIAIDTHGNVFITDMVTRTIHSIKQGRLDSLLILDYPKTNGLFIEGTTLRVGTAQGIVAFDVHNKSATLEIAHQGGINGIKPFDNGRYIVSDGKGKIQIIKKDTPAMILMDTSDQKNNTA